MSGALLDILSNIAVASILAWCAYAIGWRNPRSMLAHGLWLAVLVKLVTPPVYPVLIPVQAGWYDGVMAALSPEEVVRRSTPSLSALQLSPTSGRAFGAIRSTNSGSIRRTSDRWVHQAGEEPALLAKATGSIASFASNPWNLFFSLWIGMALWLLTRGAIKYVKLRRLLASAGMVDPRGNEIIRQLLAGRPDRGSARPWIPWRGGVEPCHPRLVRIPANLAPMLFGLGRSTTIVCPDKLWRQLSEAQQRAFIAHEVSHYLRRDHWVRWLEWAISSIYWWLPLTYLARRQLELHEEVACDDWVVRRLGLNRRCYVETLLEVVEFLSQSSSRAPRLASQMQPTGLLERRVKILMSSPIQLGNRHTQFTVRYAVLGLVAAILCIHPLPLRVARSVHRGSAVPTAAASLDSPQSASSTLGSHQPTYSPALGDRRPEPPRGWWSRQPLTNWASIELSSQAVLYADSKQHLRLLLTDGDETDLTDEQITCFTELPESRLPLGGGRLASRLICGDARGQLRVWEPHTGTAVSLIGRHAAAITSLAYDLKSGLAVGDAQGSVILWDRRSGNPLRTWTAASGPIQSVRWSEDGSRMAVVVGDWHSAEQQLVLLDARLQVLSQHALGSSAAMVYEDEYQGWLRVSWNGEVSELATGKVLTRLSKNRVSALHFGQHPRPLPPQAANPLSISKE